MRVVVVSASSDIGFAVCEHWRSLGYSVVGTYRTESAKTRALAGLGVQLVHCDLADNAATESACQQIGSLLPAWDALVICPGTLEPIGLFAECSFDDWAASVNDNFVSQMRCLHGLLPYRSRTAELGPCVILWAGGGVNNAPIAFSAYTVSKIAQIKMAELLDAEIADTRFVILGPGWVKTKIHQQTLDAGARAGAAHEATMQRLAAGEAGAWTPMRQVLAACDWVLTAPRAVVGGRNFSVAGDPLGSPALAAALTSDSGLFKLRRFGNDLKVKSDT